MDKDKKQNKKQYKNGKYKKYVEYVNTSRKNVAQIEYLATQEFYILHHRVTIGYWEIFIASSAVHWFDSWSHHFMPFFFQVMPHPQNQLTFI